MSWYSFGQSEKILYVVDSIPVIEEPKEGFGTLTEDQIDNVFVTNDVDVIKSSGHDYVDKIIYIITKAYKNRPDSIKSIPTAKLMVKKNGFWHLKNDATAYSGKFIDYYLNGKKQGEGTFLNGKLSGQRLFYHVNGTISDKKHYVNGISNGLEERFYEDGTLRQKGNFKNGKEVGVWEIYHPNGQLQQRTTFNDNGKMDGVSLSFYSTGKEKGTNTYSNGVYQKDKIDDKIFKYYNQGQELYKQFNFKSAIKKYTKCIELRDNWADGYFARGTAHLNNLEFDKAITDFNKTLEIEPYFTNAYANRAFAIIRKHEFKNSRTLSGFKDVQIVASKNVEIPSADLILICNDLNRAVSLGDDNNMVLEAIKKYCTE
jgi:tetratricopeptide (TPR) repeat protein